MNLGKYRPMFTPKSLAEQVKGAAFKNAIGRIPKETLKLSVSELEQGARKTDIMVTLKENFWTEVLRCADTGEKVDTKRVWKGVCTYTNFYKYVLNDPIRLAWLISPATELAESTKPFLSSWLEEVRKIMELEVSTPLERADIPVIQAKIRVWEALNEYWAE